MRADAEDRPMLTVLVATYNGAHTLPKSLDAYCQLQAPAGGWKLVIVDNGSSDETKQIIRSFSDRLPVTYIVEPSRGKSVALNSGLSRVEGDLAVFTDDDVLPREDWLIEMRRAADSQPSFSIFGGAIVPHWEVWPADWVLEHVPQAPVFGATDPSWAEGPIAPGFVFGANMGIRVEIFERGHRFNAEIGPRGGNYAMGSETELTLRLASAGIKAWHCRRAIVEHIVRRSQLNQRWILHRARKLGREQYRLRIQREQVNNKFLLGVPRWLIKQTLRESLGAGYAKLAGDSAQAFQSRWKFNYLLGQAIEARILHGERKASNPRRLNPNPQSGV